MRMKGHRRLLGKRQGKAVPRAEQGQPAQSSVPGSATAGDTRVTRTQGGLVTLSGQRCQEGSAPSIRKAVVTSCPHPRASLGHPEPAPARGQDTGAGHPIHLPSLPTPSCCSGISAFPAFHPPQPYTATIPTALRDPLFGQEPRFAAGFALPGGHTSPGAVPSPGAMPSPGDIPFSGDTRIPGGAAAGGRWRRSV